MAVNSRDSINLVRLLKRLENPETPAPALVRAENVKYARTLAKRVYGSDTNPYEQRLNAVEHRLDASSIASSYRRKAPSVRSYTSMIEPLVIPPEKANEPSPLSPGEPSPTTRLNEEDPASLVSQMLLPSEELSPTVATTTSLLPAPSEKVSAISPEFLTASRQTQDEISQRLAEMAVQLRRNVQHFSAALEDDKEAIAETDSKLDANYTVMQKERGRLSTYSKTSRSTTWLVVLSLLVVGIAWVVMFFVIRLT
ncbi:hypothetical protein M408DRAFT_325542 [Serendipita vermifera MAFF 305830]|uniref:t-SNARE coiled-coil homology domain-containing protein n=1 Tax=Serendipita vermifera MAFF 305830 TaxID=933852 RepID=A0A0C2XYR6_SERVB|nr:hypothetical protein M408DRAFT_325542 [Serendipita vermifera MAFF 305830]